MIRIHKSIRKLHLWLGLSCGIIASFSGITGALYVWQPELSSILNPELLNIELREHLDEEALLQTTKSLVKAHKDSVKIISLPYRERETIALTFENGQTNYYHPYNNRLLGEQSTSIQFFKQLLVLHRSLGIPIFGKYIVGISTLVFFVLLLISGVYIWWKIYAKNLGRGLLMKWKSSKRKFNFDLHKVFGIYFSIPLLIIAFSGAYFTFNTTYKAAFKLLDSKVENTEKQLLSQPNQFTDIFGYISSNTNDYKLRAIYLNQEKPKNYRLRYISNRSIKSGLRRTKEINLKEGTPFTIYDYNSAPLSEQITSQFYPIHIGEIIGISGRILVFISGIVPLLLLITGFKIYFSKSKRL